MLDVSFAEALKRLEGEQLSSVEFLQDYVQLRFDGPCLSAYNTHQIASSSSRVVWSETGYCDALCQLIGHRVLKTTLAADRISISFDNEVVWSLSFAVTTSADLSHSTSLIRQATIGLINEVCVLLR